MLCKPCFVNSIYKLLNKVEQTGFADSETHLKKYGAMG